ncbi:hypothetical protein BDZ89DRAFT_1060966 [Hymenopellis radicata]|nr:hypothetical protein BDZ89DRAFT_1060966 [Hymenopellis radicata]
MNSHKSSPLRDRLLSNSPDPIKSSILRESGMGWNSPPSSESNGSGNSVTSPLRLQKRDHPVRPPLPEVHRRSSSSYRHVRNNNLVSKSPFKSQIPMPLGTPTRSSPLPSTVPPRKVSGEKRARPLSMHEQAENENERPFALKRERRQSKTYQGLIQKEPVTKSPFRRGLHSDSDPSSSSSSDPPPTSETEPPLPPLPSSDPDLPVPSRSHAATPTRPSLVSRRLHGPRASGRRERRKTVTWDERCDVVEISCGEEGSDDALDMDSSDEEPSHPFEEHADPFFQGDQDDDQSSANDSYESIDIQAIENPLELDPDTSITGLVDEMFGSRHQSTPPRHGADIPTDLETEDGVPFGRSHHADRAAYQHHEAMSPPPIPFNPTSTSSPMGSLDRMRGSPMNTGRPRSNSDILDDYEDEDIQMLPESPSPVKSRRNTMPSGSPVPPFRLSIGSPTEDPYVPPSLPDESLPVKADESFQDEATNPDSSFARSDLDISALEEELNVHQSTPDKGQPEVSTTTDSPFSVARRPPLPLTPSAAISPLGAASSPSLRTTRSPESVNTTPDHRKPRISLEELQQRLTQRRSFGSPSPGPSPHSSSRPNFQAGDYLGAPGAVKDEEEKDRDTTSIMTAMTDVSAISAETATIMRAEKHIVDVAVAVVESSREDPAADSEFGMLKADDSHRLKFDFGSKFGRGLGFEQLDSADETGSGSPLLSVKTSLPLESSSMQCDPSADTNSIARTEISSVDVDMDMRSALDRLMDDVSSHRLEPRDITMSTEDGDESLERLQDEEPMDEPAIPRIMERAATDSAIIINAPPNGLLSRSASGASSTTIPPPVPPKDNIRNREALILEKRREMRRLEEEDEAAFYGRPPPRAEHLAVSSGRPSRRRSRSTGDVDDVRVGTKRYTTGGLLDIGPLSPQDDDPLGDSIEKELRKLEAPQKSKYQVRQHVETIYASSDNNVSHAGDLNTGRAWKTVRRPSDMNEYSKQIKEYRAQEKPGKAYGKVFVKVLGLKGISTPMPQEPTAVSCTLNNGIHFVTTPECRFSPDCAINQEFELIEHSKLEFTLTLKIRRDPHIISQFKALAPPPAAPIAPPPVVHTSSKSGMRSFFSSSPKKSKEKLKAQAPPAQPAQPVHRLPENLARYLKPDGTLARAFISFKDVAQRCDTRIFETAFPLIGQKLEAGNKSTTAQVGEMVLQIFRLPPLPGIAPDQLPQSLEECHRGLRHINWHKVTYFEGTLTQSGGDCLTWRRRQLRVIGSNLVAFNDVTKKATATISLKKAITVEDDKAVRDAAMSPASASTSRSRYADDYDGMYGVERSFRLVFPDEEIIFFADTDEEKEKWLEVLRALVGHIPPHPLWAELLWQRAEEMAKANRRTSTVPKKGPV